MQVDSFEWAYQVLLWYSCVKHSSKASSLWVSFEICLNTFSDESLWWFQFSRMDFLVMYYVNSLLVCGASSGPKLYQSVSFPAGFPQLLTVFFLISDFFFFFVSLTRKKKRKMTSGRDKSHGQRAKDLVCACVCGGVKRQKLLSASSLHLSSSKSCCQHLLSTSSPHNHPGLWENTFRKKRKTKKYIFETKLRFCHGAMSIQSGTDINKTT